MDRTIARGPRRVSPSRPTMSVTGSNSPSRPAVAEPACAPPVVASSVGPAPRPAGGPPHGPTARAGRLARLARPLCWLAAAALGLVQTWANRARVVNDGVAYLDMGDALVRGDWATALNAHWSPLFGWAMGLVLAAVRPSPQHEPLVVHLVTFAVYLATVAAFDVLLRELHRAAHAAAAIDGGVPLPEWAVVLLGHAIFLWASLDLVTAHGVTPDMAVAAVLYLVGALLLRIRRGAATTRTHLALGALLGVGYLVKAPLLPVACVVLPVALLAERAHGRARARRRALGAGAVFLGIATPLVVALSVRQGRLTFGESRTYVYGVYVAHQLPLVHWRGEPPGTGTPAHPTRRVLDAPTVHEFGRPLGGTYPPWQEPAYWYEGVDLRASLARQLDALALGAGRELRLLTGDRVANTRGASRALLAGLLVLLVLGARGRRTLRDVGAFRVLLVPALAMLAMYAVVHVEARYVAPPLALLLLVVVASVRLPPTRLRLASGVAIAAAALGVWPLVRDQAWSALTQWRTRSDDDAARATPAQVAAALGAAGVRRGDRLAYVGSSTNFYWARLAGARVVAEVRQFTAPTSEVWYISAAHAARVQRMTARDVDAFWAATPERRDAVLRAFARAGARHVVTNAMPPGAPAEGWRPLPGTRFHVRALAPALAAVPREDGR
jgi:hypothetical protein